MEDADIKILDYSFVLNQCFGPWRPKRQKEVWQTAYKIFKEDCKGDLRNATDSVDMGFQLNWQKERMIKMSKFLNKNKLSFTEFIKETENMNGVTVRDEFKRILGSVTTKTISTFIRDCLRKDVFPIDTRVQKILSYVGLPVDEDMMVYLSRKVGLNPRVFERMLYKHYGERCGKKSPSVCQQCPMREYCFWPIFIKSMFEVKLQ